MANLLDLNYVYVATIHKKMRKSYSTTGMVMPGRQFNSGSYRYGFNGKENDNEVKGTGVQQDYGMRIYDTRIAKFLSVDPLGPEYPFFTPYQFASNRPIDGIDLDGLEFCKKGYFTRENIINRLIALKNNPGLINQRSAGTCVIAAVTYLWIKNDWKSFVGATMSLYYTGTAKVNNYEIEANPLAYGLNPGTKGSSQQDGSGNLKPDEAVDWMVLNSIQNTQNGPQYGIVNEKAGNDLDDTKNFMTELLNLKDVDKIEYSQDDYKPTATIITNMEYRNKNGYQEIISINPNAIIPGAFKDNNGNLLTGQGGHQVVYAGNLKTRLNANNELEYSFDVITWGSEKPTTIPFIDSKKFNEYFKGSVYGKPQDKPKDDKGN